MLSRARRKRWQLALAMASAGWLLAPGTLWAQPDSGTDDDWGHVDNVEDLEDVEVEDLEESDTWYAGGYPVFDRFFNLLSARPARPLSFIFTVHHRVNSPIRIDPFDNFLGFDSGALKIGLSLRFGIFEDLDVGLMRINGTIESYDTYEMDLRYRLTNERDHFVNLAVRLGASWFVMPNSNHALKPFGQILVDRVLFNRLFVSVGLLVHGDSTNPVKAQTDTEWTLAASVAADFRILDWLAWGAEGTFAFAGYYEKYPTFTTGPKIITNRHTFSIVVTNTQYISADGIITHTAREPEDVILGFTITREINL